jgi:hypothetical protein
MQSRFGKHSTDDKNQQPLQPWKDERLRKLEDYAKHFNNNEDETST